MSKSNGVLRKLLKPFAFNSTRDDNELNLAEFAAKERKCFSVEALVTATQNFDRSLKLGEGGFGPVFRGKLSDGREIAVKRLSDRSTQGKKEFKNEAKSLSLLQHRNVVNLIGYCADDAERLLVYEYVQNESLDKLLFKSNRRDLLDWKRRHAVIIGIAKGLLYLHEEAPVCILHRDIKASNILLDDKWCPKIADFGMARFFPQDQTHVSTYIVGTKGYMAPEYFLRGHLSDKADVFSFGVVILELISGQKNSAFNRDPSYHNLVEWAYDLCSKKRSWEIMDPVLASSADQEQVEVCVHVGLLCVQSDPNHRPKMSRVIKILSRKPSSNLEHPARPGYTESRCWTRSESSSATGTSLESKTGGTCTLTTPTSTRSRHQHHAKGSVKY